MNNFIHVYRQRHIFHGDDYIGNYHVPTRTATIRHEHGEHLNKVKAHYLRAFGIIIKAAIEGQPPAQGGYQAIGDMLENEPDAIAPDTRLGDTPRNDVFIQTPRMDAVTDESATTIFVTGCELERELTAAQQDSRRLEWLIGNRFTVTPYGCEPPCFTTREEIDAAMEGGEK